MYGSRFIGQWLAESTQHRAYPCQQNLRTERLREIVIRTEFKPRDDVGFIAFCRDNNDRNIPGIGILLETPANLHTVNSRQHQIQQHQVRMFLPDFCQPFFPGLESIGVVTILLQVVEYKVTNIFLIFYQGYSGSRHAFTPGRKCIFKVIRVA